MAKVSELSEQIDLSGDDLSNVFDELRSGDLEARQLALLGETVGRQGGALLGRRVGEAIGQAFADEEGTLSFASIMRTLRGGGSEESEAGDDSTESDEGENAPSEQSENSEVELEGDGSGSFDDMSDDELQNLANDLMDELDQRQSSDS
jgi:hypothetical protein